MLLRTRSVLAADSGMMSDAMAPTAVHSLCAVHMNRVYVADGGVHASSTQFVYATANLVLGVCSVRKTGTYDAADGGVLRCSVYTFVTLLYVVTFAADVDSDSRPTNAACNADVAVLKHCDADVEVGCRCITAVVTTGVYVVSTTTDGNAAATATLYDDVGDASCVTNAVAAAVLDATGSTMSN